jgi:hypothetical protein
MPRDPQDEKLSESLTKRLEEQSPFALYLWREVVYPLKVKEFEETARLYRLIDSRQIMSGVLIQCTCKESTEAELWNWFTTFAEGSITHFQKKNKEVQVNQFVPKKKSLTFIAAGLSFLQFLAIAEILGVQLNNLELADIPLTIVSGVAALSLTFGAKEALVRWVKAKHASCSQSFVKSILSGDTLAWASVAIVLMEAAFTAPGLIALLPPALSLKLVPLLTAYIASGLAAYVNVLLSWSLALEELDFEKRFKQVVEVRTEEIDRKIKNLSIDPSTARMIRRNYDKEVQEQRKTVDKLRRMHHKALKRFMQEIKALSQDR